MNIIYCYNILLHNNTKHKYNAYTSNLNSGCAHARAGSRPRLLVLNPIKINQNLTTPFLWLMFKGKYVILIRLCLLYMHEPAISNRIIYNIL